VKPDDAAKVDEVLTRLAQTPLRIKALTAGGAPARLQTRPAEDEWSANDVLAHLRACADVWGKFMLTIIEEDRPTLVGVNPRSWINKTDYRERRFGPSFRAFAAQRAELLAVLEPLPLGDWSRTATVTDMIGQGFERNVLYYADWLARHERPHLKQIERIVKADG
jgi:hypothetical protein